MIAFAFADPFWLGLLALVPAWLWVDAMRTSQGAGAVVDWIGARRERLSSPLPAPKQMRNGRVAGAVGVALLALALARPQWGEMVRRSGESGADLVICLDVSRSMRARDVAPDRATVARRMLHRFCAESVGDRAALVLFAGEAMVRVPLTTDLVTLNQIGAAADELDVAKGGMDLAAALDAAALALVGTEGGAVVVLTDGEDRDGRGLAAAQHMRASGIAVHVVAIGTERGARIPVVEQGREDYLRDAKGLLVETAPDHATLEALAAAGGGSFEAVLGGEQDTLLQLRRGSIADGIESGAVARGDLAPADRFAPLLALAAGVWLVCLLLRRAV